MIEFNTYFRDLPLWLVVMASFTGVLIAAGDCSGLLLDCKFRGFVTHICQVVACKEFFDVSSCFEMETIISGIGVINKASKKKS